MEKELQTINGIKIYDYRNKKIGSFALSLFLKRGAMFDSEEESGTAHLFALLLMFQTHMLVLFSTKLVAEKAK